MKREDHYLGLTGDDAKLLRVFTGAWDKAGIPKAKQRAVRQFWDANCHRYKNLSTDDESLRAFATRFVETFCDDLWHTTAQTFDGVVDGGGLDKVELPDPPTPAQDKAEYARLEKMRREDPASYSEFESQHALDIEERKVEREAGMKARDLVRDDGGMFRAGPKPDPDRLAEIRAVLKTDYPRYQNDPSMKAEYLDLVGREASAMEALEPGGGESAPEPSEAEGDPE